MTNCHNLFSEFNSTIKLADSKKKSLKKSRKSLRDKIRKYFDEEKKGEIKPKFTSQGSFVLDTIVEPIPKVEENDVKKTLLNYDMDDGVYFIGDINERKSVQTYHIWIIDAIEGHTQTGLIDKNTCVRTEYADGHHIDMPIYFKEEGKTPELAHKAKGWIESDPKAFQNWFEGKVVRYLKAWSNYRETQRTDKPMVSGFILTILAANHYCANDRDDIALKETLILIKAKLDASFICYRPTVPTNEDLLASYNHKDYFMECLQKFIDSASTALKEPNQKKSCEHWQKHFGDRFPCDLAKDEDEEEKLSASFISTASASRPWSM
jgi:Second Messenger Oligonucleotide or Dinucleotide Synthetase domain